MSCIPAKSECVLSLPSQFQNLLRAYVNDAGTVSGPGIFVWLGLYVVDMVISTSIVLGRGGRLCLGASFQGVFH